MPNHLDRNVSRRRALQILSLGTCGLLSHPLSGATPSKRRWTFNLMPGMIGVSGDQREIINLAAKHGFESVEPNSHFLSKLNESELEALLDEMSMKKVIFGAAGLPVEFRQDEEKFNDGVKNLPALARGLQRARVKRIGTWLSPGNPRLTFLQNFKQTSRRLRDVAKILGDHDLKLGLEYVGTKTSRDRMKFEFVHTMAETRELIAEIGVRNVGFLLDSWHWWQAGDTPADIMSLTADQIVAVDLNDAPAGLDKDKQLDGQRELPMATGVIDIKPFLECLQALGYDGPVRAEPFNRPLNQLDNDEACAQTIAALKKAAALLI